MSSENLIYFARLKQEVAEQFRQTYPSCVEPIENWRGQDIVDFQEELLRKVNGQISEKWFYTHMKNTGDSLPRIDMLNLLSQYAGYESWKAFLYSKKEGEKQDPIAPVQPQEKGSRRYRMLVTVFAVVAISVYFLVIRDNSTSYSFCFVESLRNTPITDHKIELTLLNDDESPVKTFANDSGCFHLNLRSERIRFVVRSPYYKTDTITRILNAQSRSVETIPLRTNDYALMIHFISSAKMDDWKKRRKQLEDMIADQAQIIQVYEGTMQGMEMYGKGEFINKLTMPVKSLRNIEILESNYKDGKISFIRFVQKSDDHE